MLFINEYRDFFRYLVDEIDKTFRNYKNLSVLEKAEILWKNCFSSPVLQFEDYWCVDKKRDLITNIRYPEVEKSISMSEKVLLSIWRHQFDDSIKTEDFLLCSVDYHKIYELYIGLDNLKFYHMHQISLTEA